MERFFCEPVLGLLSGIVLGLAGDFLFDLLDDGFVVYLADIVVAEKVAEMVLPVLGEGLDGLADDSEEVVLQLDLGVGLEALHAIDLDLSVDDPSEVDAGQAAPPLHLGGDLVGFDRVDHEVGMGGAEKRAGVILVLGLDCHRLAEACFLVLVGPRDRPCDLLGYHRVLLLGHLAQHLASLLIRTVEAFVNGIRREKNNCENHKDNGLLRVNALCSFDSFTFLGCIPFFCFLSITLVTLCLCNSFTFCGYIQLSCFFHGLWLHSQSMILFDGMISIECSVSFRFIAYDHLSCFYLTTWLRSENLFLSNFMAAFFIPVSFWTLGYTPL